MNKILVTGAAGFIGYHVAKRLVGDGYTVTGLDNINDYYDVNLKYARLQELGIEKGSIVPGSIVPGSRVPGSRVLGSRVPGGGNGDFRFTQMRLEDKDGVLELFRKEKFDAVVHLAAQAGVRYSLENPQAYINSNITGHLNVLEACRHHPVQHLVFASSSSVYGINEKMPLSVADNVDHPISLYAATKKADELMSHVYSHLFGIPVTGLRFFTVYGPWGRPDMALFIFTRAMLAGREIEIFNNGDMVRDFTYIDDIVEGITRILRKPSACNPEFDRSRPDPSISSGPYRIYNIGNSNPVRLEAFIDAIEKELGIKAKRKYLPIQPGDVPRTYADVTRLEHDFGYKPTTSVEQGIHEFITWYRAFYAS